MNDLTQEENEVAEEKRFQINQKLLKNIVFSATLWGVAAHGMMLFNKYSYNDDAVAFNGVGTTFKLGRWMLQLLGDLTQKVFGGKLYSIPLVNGALTILCVAAIVYFLMDGLEIQSKPATVLLCGIMVTFPSVTETLLYMYTAPYYYFASLMGVAGAWLFHRKKSIGTALVCTVLMACSVGVYQSNIAVCACALLLFMLDDICRSDADWKYFWKTALCNAAICIGFMAEYLLINWAVLKYLGETLWDYQGVSSFGKTSLSNYVYRVLYAYRCFFCPDNYMAPFHAKYVYILWGIAAIVIAMLALRKIADQKVQKAWQTGLIIAVYPLAACIIYVMTDVENVYSRMNFGQAFSFVLLVWLAERFLNAEKLEGILRKAAMFLMGILAVLYIFYSNICYLRADVLQSEMISWYTTLITQIRSIEGYTDEAQVVYIGEYNKEDKNMVGVKNHFDQLYVEPYKGSLLNNYAWKEMMELWCGFSPELGDATEFEGNAEVAAMPCYPDYGSIRCINGKIVVKFANEQ